MRHDTDKKKRENYTYIYTYILYVERCTRLCQLFTRGSAAVWES